MTNRTDLINEFLAEFNASSDRFIEEGSVEDAKTERKLAELQIQNHKIVNLVVQLSTHAP